MNPELIIDGNLDYLYDLPKEFGGTLESGIEVKDSLMSFDIKTSAEEAQRAYEQKE